MSFRDPAGAPDATAESTAPGPAIPADPPLTGPDQSTATERGKASGRAATGRNMLPERERRRFGVERLLVRLVATCGIVGIGVALGAILASSNVQGWITGLVVALVSVVLSAILWSSRQV